MSREALEAAHEVWMYADPLGTAQRLQKARELDGYGLFSVSMLAKICRLSTPYVRKAGLGRGVSGGKFHPESLGALIMVAKNASVGYAVNPYMVKVAVQAGCSLNVVSKLTKIPYTTIHRIQED